MALLPSPLCIHLPLYRTILPVTTRKKFDTICSLYIQSLKTTRLSEGLLKPSGCPAEM